MMTSYHIRNEIKIAIWFVFLLALSLPFAQPTAAAPPQPPAGVRSLSEAAPQGFNDQHNGFAWSMTWWRGHLYVGTGRDFACWQAGVRAAVFPGLASFICSPRQPTAVCTADPADLPLQAEIWRWTPETDTWERVYQSPVDVPVPGQPGTFIAHDTAYRGMLVFTEPDGTEALYVTAISPRALFRVVQIRRPRASCARSTAQPSSLFHKILVACWGARPTRASGLARYSTVACI